MTSAYSGSYFYHLANQTSLKDKWHIKIASEGNHQHIFTNNRTDDLMLNSFSSPEESDTYNKHFFANGNHLDKYINPSENWKKHVAFDIITDNGRRPPT